jgi:hypothetical protein
MLERLMAAKNKGGREVRKPKQAKKAKPASEGSVIARLEPAPRKPRHTK